MYGAKNMGFETSLGLNPTSVISSCVAVNKLLNLSEPRFLHLSQRENNTYHTGLLWESEIIYDVVYGT